MKNNWDMRLREFDEEPVSERAPRKVRTAWILLVLLLVLINILCIFVAFREHYYRRHFLPGTKVNGQDISGRTAEEVKDAISRKIDSYTLKVYERDENGETIAEEINGSEIALEMNFGTGLEKALYDQTHLEWLKRLIKRKPGEDLVVESAVHYNRQAWKMKLESMRCLAEEYMTPPRNAKIGGYEDGLGYVIEPESLGNTPDRKKVRKLLSEAVLSLDSKIDLTEIPGLYEDPQIFSNDPALLDKREKLNKYATIRIVYNFGDKQEVLDGNIIHNWIKVDNAGNVSLDTSHVTDYIATLRKKYDTIFRERDFHTSYGYTIGIEGGDYGWWMDYPTEEEELRKMLVNAESGERTPVYHQTAAQYGDQDYGDTYVEVNLTAQHIFFYKNGVMMLESDCVSGNASKGNDTPEGIYGITYKERNATLEGENYSTPVSWWMPFNENVGLHDATWRKKFGGRTYLSSGSHGCVNLPYTVARDLYQMVEKGTPVICYHLEGTETKETTAQDDADIAQSAIDAIDAIGTVEKTENCEKLIKRARQLYNGLSGKGRKYVYNYDTLKAAEKEYKSLK